MYQQYVFSKQTLLELSQKHHCSIKSLQRKFDELPDVSPPDLLFSEPINLIVDATFFSRSDGVLVFRAERKNVHWQFIQSETLHEINQGLDELDRKGYCFQSIVLDGRRGVIKLFEQRYPGYLFSFANFIKRKLFDVTQRTIQKLTVGKH